MSNYGALLLLILYLAVALAQVIAALLLTEWKVKRAVRKEIATGPSHNPQFFP